MMILTKKSKKVIQIAAILGASGVLLSGLSAVFFAPQPSASTSGTQTVQTDANGNIIDGGSQTIQIQTDANGNATIPSQTGQ